MFDNLQDSDNGGVGQDNLNQPYKRLVPPPIPRANRVAPTNNPSATVQQNRSVRDANISPGPSAAQPYRSPVEDMFSETNSKEKPLIFQPKNQAKPNTSFGGDDFGSMQAQMDPYTGESINSIV